MSETSARRFDLIVEAGLNPADFWPFIFQEAAGPVAADPANANTSPESPDKEKESCDSASSP